MASRPRPLALSLVGLATAAVLGSGVAVLAPVAVDDHRVAAHATTERVGQLDLLTDPFLQLPTADGVSVVWMTEYAGDDHVVLVGDDVASLTPAELASLAAGGTRAGVRVVAAETTKFSRMAEDAGSFLADKPAAAEGIVERDVWRHEGVVTGLRTGEKVPYRIVSRDGSEIGASGTFRLSPLPAKGQGQKILLTSDHQSMVNTPANLQIARETVGEIDAVFMAGDLVNIPDRASEWFDDNRGSGFFPVLQGRGGRVATNGTTYVGGAIVQEAPIYPAVGNHEVQGRIDGATGLNASFNAPVPVEVAEREYEKVKDDVNPTGDPAVREQWIEDNSFSTTTYEEVFTLPESSPGGETYYATTIGDVRLVSLYSTRIWRGTQANPDPADRAATSRYQESRNVLDKPLEQGWGEHVFESLESGSEQLEWLEEELASDEFRDARYRVVLMHEGPQGLGDNVMPVFAHPERIETRDASGRLTGVRYEYRTEDNMLVRDLQPLLEEAGVDLVHNGHSHLWNRFRSKEGVNYIETSNTGNTYGAYHGLSGRVRPVPPAPWDASNYLPLGNPGGLRAEVPTVKPFTTPEGIPQPFVQSNNHVVFTVLDTAANEVVSYAKDMRSSDPAEVFDRFSLGRTASGLAVSDVSTRFGTATDVAISAAAGVTGEVVVRSGDEVVARGRVEDGVGTVRLPATALRPGEHRLVASLAGTKQVAGATAEFTVQVDRATSRVKVAKVKGQGRADKVVAGSTRAKVTVRVSGAVDATGRVVVRSAGKRLATGTLRDGRVVVTLPRFVRPGVKRLVVSYRGSDLLTGSKVRQTVRVVRR